MKHARILDAIHDVLTLGWSVQTALDNAETDGTFGKQLRRRIYAVQTYLVEDALIERGDPVDLRVIADELELEAKCEHKSVFISDEYHAQGGGLQDVMTARWFALKSAATALTLLADALEDLRLLLRAENLLNELTA